MSPIHNRLVFAAIALSSVVLIAFQGCRQPSIAHDGGVVVVLEPIGELNSDTMMDLEQDLGDRLTFFGMRGYEVGSSDGKIKITIPKISKEQFEKFQSILIRRGHLEFLILAENGQHDDLVAAALRQNGNPDEKKAQVVADDSGATLGKWIRIRRDLAQLNYNSTNSTGSYYLRDATTGDIFGVDQPSIQNEEVPLKTWLKDNHVSDLEILVVNPDEKERLEINHLRTIRSGFDEHANPAISFATTDEGAKILGRLTSKHKPQDGHYFQLAMIFDNELQSSPRINSVITDNGIIQGNFTQDEIGDMVKLLHMSPIPVALTVVSLDEVKPKK